LSKNTALTNLSCSTNQLDKLDVRANEKLKTLWCRGNRLTDLDVRQNTALETLVCNNNQLKRLDLSRNKHLKQLRCQRNRLEYLDITGFRITPSHSTRYRFEIYYGNYKEEQHLKTLKVNEVLQDDYEIDEVKTSSPKATVHVYNDQGEETCTDYQFTGDYDKDSSNHGYCTQTRS
ncbi:MAG: leucine-rich repeat domain-containing protein, partial [Flavobacteriales bacterium]